MQGLKLADIQVDRKMLADLAVHDGAAFAQIADAARAALPAETAALAARQVRV